MTSNLYDSTLASGISSSEIKLNPTSFYTPTSFPQSSNNLHQQSQLQQQRLPQQEQQLQQQSQDQFYSHAATHSYGNLSDSFMSIPSPPPLEPDTMNPYMGNGAYGQLPLSSQYGEYYATTAGGYVSQGQVPRSMEFNLMLQYNLSQSHLGSEYPQSPVPSPHSSHHGLLVDTDWYRDSRRTSLSRSQSPHQVSHSAKDEGEEIEDTKAEMPYAKLIHKALMEAPNHAMSLQDIYKWFLENTEKGNSIGSGWRNSIRHNLSMNQAFRKSDKNAVNSPSDGAPKKTSEWVLEPWAVADGVTPTTRYRQKVAKKASHRDQSSINSLRQSAGKKGGNMAGRTKALRTREMTRISSRQCSREGSLGRDSYDRDYYGRSSAKRQCTEGFMRNSPPMEDPITPTASNLNGPYYGTSSHAYYDDVALEPEYSLGDVQGVYDEHLYSGPIFSYQAMPKFGGGTEYGSLVATE